MRVHLSLSAGGGFWVAAAVGAVMRISYITIEGEIYHQLILSYQ